MKTMRTAIIITAMVTLINGNAWADIKNEYTDSWNNWNNDKTLNDSLKNNDENGDPKISSMNIWTSDNGLLLKKIEIILSTPTRVIFDSLFINTNFTSSTKWDNWTYLVHSGGSANSTYNKPNGTTAVTTDGLYKVKSVYDYTYADTRSGYILRTGNPNGIDFQDLELPNNSIVGTLSSQVITYDLTSLSDGGLALTGGFFVAYSPYCANDVIGDGKRMDPVPEPATMLLFGTGIAGLAGMVRRRRMHN